MPFDPREWRELPMNSSADPDLVKITEVFLVPSSFLVAALGTADTNPHRAIVSILGFIVSNLWMVCSWEAFSERRSAAPATTSHPRRIRIMTWLPMLFVVGWLLSVVAHLWLWSRPLGH
jgi:hypothetical protein